MKHFYIFTFMAEPWEVDVYSRGKSTTKTFMQVFYFTCNHLSSTWIQRAKTLVKMFCNIFADRYIATTTLAIIAVFLEYLGHLCKCFSIKIFRTFLEVVTCKIKHYGIFTTFLQMFYFTCNHGQYYYVAMHSVSSAYNVKCVMLKDVYC